MNIIPINSEDNLFFGYFDDDESPISLCKEILEDLNRPIESASLRMGNDCLHRWKRIVEDLNEDREYSLYMGIIVPSMELFSINSVIEQFDSHDIKIIFEKKLSIIKLEDDFDFARPHIVLNPKNEEVVLDVEFILLKINPNHRLNLDARQVVSYLLAVILRMFSLLESHLYFWHEANGISYPLLEETIPNSEDSLEFLCTVNNYYVENSPGREQIICGTIKISSELLLRINDIKVTNMLFKDYGMEKPTQTDIVLTLGEVLE